MPGRKRETDASQQVRKRRTLGAASARMGSVVATTLLIKWAWGILVAPDVQELAMAIKLAGNEEEEVDDLASCGAYGENRGSISKDLKA
eukprot:7449048-Lingulodinium_polyedra.AAC.1